MARNSQWQIRPARKEDVPSILWLSTILGETHQTPHTLCIGGKEIIRDGFGDQRKYFYVLLAELTSENSLVIDTTLDRPSTSMPHDSKIVGQALYYFTYSTWEGKCFFLEDLCVKDEFRSRGIGTSLLRACAKIACEKDCARMVWQVAEWNTRGKKLYERIGGKILKEWLTVWMRLPQLKQFSDKLVTVGRPWTIRPAKREDLPSILWLTQVLAEYENEPEAMKIGGKEMARDGFGERPSYHVLIAEWTSSEDIPSISTTVDPTRPSTSMPHNPKIVGHALYFYTYSTWVGRCLYLEDLCVREEFRSRGIGSALMQACAKVAVEEGCARMIWQVLDWNTKAIDLYERIGGDIVKEWLTIRMVQPEIEKFAHGHSTSINSSK